VDWIYFFIAAASHGVLDAFTDGGLGVAFFSPFDTRRYFFPVTPISVSPVGVSFFSVHGLFVLLSELVWLWLPAFAFVVAALCVRKRFHGSNFPHNYWRAVRAPFANARPKSDTKKLTACAGSTAEKHE
jgi:hypothetical protein